MINFGGGKQSTSSSAFSSSKPIQLGLYTPDQQQIMKDLFERFESGLNMPVPAYPGMMYAPMSGYEKKFIDAGSAQGEQIGGYQEALNRALSGKPAYDINPEISKEYFQKSILPLMRDQYETITLPQVSESFAGPGYWGSARAGAEGKAASDFATQAGSTGAQIMYSDELARRQALESAAQRSAGLSLPSLQAGLGAMGSAGQYARMIEQEKIQADYMRWLSGETVNGVTPTQYNPFLQLAFQYMGLQPWTYGMESTSSSQSKGSGWNLSAGFKWS